MTPDLQALIEMSEKATVGPWRLAYEGGGDVSIYGRHPELDDAEAILVMEMDGPSPFADADEVGCCFDKNAHSFVTNRWSEKNEANAKFIHALVTWFRANHSTLTAPTQPGAGGGDALDAARYRYLRDEAHPDSDQGVYVASQEVTDWGNWYSKHYAGKFLDAAIDAALPPQQGG